MSLGMATALTAPTRTPGWGMSVLGALVVTVTQPAPSFLGKVNGPMYVAPASSTMASPGWAVFRAA
jgi:hypothetical protein